jgi:hypothetical protein
MCNPLNHTKLLQKRLRFFIVLLAGTALERNSILLVVSMQSRLPNPLGARSASRITVAPGMMAAVQPLPSDS